MKYIKNSEISKELTGNPRTIRKEDVPNKYKELYRRLKLIDKFIQDTINEFT